MGEFVWAVASEKAPSLEINNDPPIPAFQAGSLWVAEGRLKTEAAYKYFWIADGRTFGGDYNPPAFGPESYSHPGVPARVSPRRALSTPKYARMRQGFRGAPWRAAIWRVLRIIWVKAENAGKELEMKTLNSMKAGLAALAMTALFGAAPAAAQPYPQFDIPFQFTAGNEVLPAGHYEVVIDHFARIQIRNTTETTAHCVALSANSKTRSPNYSQATLRFNRYDGTMFLSAAWARGQADGRIVQPSGRLAEAMKASLSESRRAGVTLVSDLN